MRFRKIGVLGGMGPQATILLQEKVLHAVQAHDDADHIPLLIDMNPQVPSRIEWLLEGGSIDPAPTLVAMAQGLVASGAEALVMPCNTAHVFADQIAQASGVPFLHMPNLAVSELAETLSTEDSVGILASPATEKTGLFMHALAAHGLNGVYPEDQEVILGAVKAIKTDGPSAEPLAVLNAAAAAMEGQGVKALLVGCSEFSLLTEQIKSHVPIVDTMSVLTRHMIGFSLNKPMPFRPLTRQI